MSIHDGHRQRLINRFIRDGLDGFEDHNVLELLLFYSIPRADTNPIAHVLLDRFGSLEKVLSAPIDELTAVPGVGEKTAVFLSFQNALIRYYRVDSSLNTKILRSVEECGAYLLPRFLGRENETVFLLCLDAKCKVKACKEIGEGSVNSTSISVRRVVEAALGANASSVILAHNHPSGIAVPSREDIQTTHRVASALAAVEIILADHLVFADGDFVSIAQSGGYRPKDYL